jgi:glycosyltransferase involved in cell wall biosynthesis
LKGIPFIYWMSFLMCEERIERARVLLAKRRGLWNYLILLKGIVESFLLYRFILPNARHIFVQSDAMASYMQTKGVKAEKMTAVPMGVDMEQFDNHDLKAARPESWGTVPVVAYLGLLNKSRDTKSLIDAFCLARFQFPTSRLILIGTSDTPTGNEELLTYAEQKGLPEGTVEITGWLPTQDAWRLLLNADVAVSYVPRSTIYDVSSPTKLMEYLAAGMPCVANDSPDQRHVLTQSDAGWLVNSNVDAMAEALIEILSDPIAARERAAIGPAYVDANRSYRVLAKMVAEQYQRIFPGQMRV